MKQHYCLLERFNNYFNRKIIKYESLSDYEDHAKDSFIPYNEDGSMTLFDFNPADNVTTEIIVNNVPFDPDYFLLLDDTAQIVQRWFVLEQKRNRQGQWVYYLRRDVIADNFNNLLDAPIFVQKGMLYDNDPFIFNSEGMSFNQIKKREILLKDKSDSSWIICYLAKSLSASNVKIDLSREEIIPNYITLNEIANDVGVSEGVLASLLNIDPGDNNSMKITKNIDLSFRVLQTGSSIKVSGPVSPNFATSDVAELNFQISGYTTLFDYRPTSQYLISSRFNEKIISNSNSLKNEMKNILNRAYYFTNDDYNKLLLYNNKIVLYLGNYYTFRIGGITQTTNNIDFQPSSHASWNYMCEEVASSYAEDFSTNCSFETSGNIKMDLIEDDLVINLESYTPLTREISVDIVSSRKVCLDQEYDIVAIPASNIELSNGVMQDGTIAQKIASALAKKETSNIYDIQLLPYCPRQEMIYENNKLDVSNFIENQDFSYIKEDNGGTITNLGIVLYCSSASFELQLNYSLSLKVSKKIDSQCDFYRLVSPNYQGNFEFNVAKNGGIVDYFKAYCTYKPYTPFIKVTPNLNDLYGRDFNDNRGLLCGGDFSLPRATSEWQRYQLENKNYQNIFNREIQNMNFMQSIEMRNQLVSGAVGIISDTAKGAGAGAYAGGGPAGAIIGGALGLTTSGIGFAIDTDTLAKTQREQRQLAIDKFNYQLGNIKALPYTLTKVGAFDISSKIFPFLEYYTCTDKEKEALTEKIKYESMTVMRIGTINEFRDFGGKKNYFKGELIRNDLIADDSHILNAIYEELLKGVYI